MNERPDAYRLARSLLGKALLVLAVAFGAGVAIGIVGALIRHWARAS